VFVVVDFIMTWSGNFWIYPPIRGYIQKFPDGRLKQELHVVHLSAIRYSCIAIL